MSKREIRTAAGALLACALAAPPGRAATSLEVVHAFPGLPGTPTSRLLQGSNGLLYGTLLQAGPKAAGSVFVGSVNSANRAYGIRLRTFDGSDGRWPTAGLVEGSDGAFYGTTLAGGAADQGTVFRITTLGQFTSLHSFQGADGARPFAGLVEADDGNLYGTTTAGGAHDRGTLFKVTPAGVLTTVHSFAGEEGARPWGALVQATDGHLYGTAREGGLGWGTVFRLTLAGAVEVLHRFDLGGSQAGIHPVAGLIQGQDGALYGTTAGAESSSPLASAFRITLSGDLTVIRSFMDTDLGSPVGGVIQGQDGALYGTALTRSPGRGAVFRIGAGGALTTVHAFTGPDGAEPYGGLIQASDGRLYGLTMLGGDRDHGTVYRVTTTGVFTSLGSFGSFDGGSPSGGVIRATDGHFYGTTTFGGPYNRGTVFRVAAGGQLTQLHLFTGPDGATPQSGVIQARNGLLYGVTSQGGAHGRGTVFVMTLGGAFQTLHSFDAPVNFASLGAAPLIEGRDGALYGIIDGLPAVQPGVVFRISPAGAFTLLATIPEARGPLVEAPDGNFYGTTFPLPFLTTRQGSVFRMTPSGVVSTVAEFLCDTPTGPCPHGAGPAGGLLAASDGALYGVTTLRLPQVQPTVFRVDENGLAVVARFEEGFLASSLIEASDGRFYGTAAVGQNAANAVYSVTAGGDISTLHVFSSAQGANLSSPLLETQPGVFYGTAREGGVATHGVVYRFTVATP
jgi:uncharacterized repeat protein (TIGR03803 family)